MGSEYQRRRLSFGRLVRTVQGRLRSRGVHVHNALTREITRQVFDVVTERFKAERDLFFRDWLRDAATRVDRKDRIVANLRRRYSREWFVSPRTRVLFKRAPVPLERRPVKYLTDEELVALLDLRDELKERGDAIGMAAIDRAIDFLRRIE